MKPLFLILTTILISTNVSGQENFEWQKIEEIEKSKTEIYNDTKLFIANNWKSPKDAIQLDDKEAGIVLLKGNIIKKVPHSMNEWTYVYRYTITFKMKDGKYNFAIDDVHCSKTYVIGQGQYDIPPIQPFEGEYDRYKDVENKMTPTLPENKAVSMMEAVKDELNLIYTGYIAHIAKQPESDGDW